MAYSDFTTVSKATRAFNLSINEEVISLFQSAPSVQPSRILSEILEENLPLAMPRATA